VTVSVDAPSADVLIVEEPPRSGMGRAYAAPA
jgi:hypothetical protein